MEDNKYYTPSIDEFYDGFEYEYCIYPENNTEFKHEVCGWDTISILFDDFEHEPKELFERTYRVKYLDKSDFEELGFNEITRRTFHKTCNNIFQNGEWFLDFNHRNGKVVIYKKREVDETTSPGCAFSFVGVEHDVFFNGKLKNKNELIKVLSYIGLDLPK